MGYEKEVRSLAVPSFADGTAEILRNAGAYFSDLVQPTVRLGVTGLARSGKTVFITALVHNLLAGGRLPFFEASARGRVRGAWLEPQPDDTVPRFAYEAHLDALFADPPVWPESTRTVSELRILIEYEPESWLRRSLGVRTLAIDIVDYPGEWLLDLPLLTTSYEDWARQSLALARAKTESAAARAWLEVAGTLDPLAKGDEQLALTATGQFKAYLLASRGEGNALSTLAPGRFLLPGEFEGTPALTFVPLEVTAEQSAPRGSLWSMMARRYNAYARDVVGPFFRDHFARLDRQIVLVDALAALNAGPAALADLERALTGILASFRTGANTWSSALFARRIDRILFAATKADHLHHLSHDRLEAVLRLLTGRAIERAEFSGAEVRSLALAAVRATREAEARQRGGVLPCIVGVPLPGERLGKQVFDGVKEIAVFPGDLPADPAQALIDGHVRPPQGGEDIRFVRFRPARASPAGSRDPLPNIRLDRAIDFLIGDRL